MFSFTKLDRQTQKEWIDCFCSIRKASLIRIATEETLFAQRTLADQAIRVHSQLWRIRQSFLDELVWLLVTDSVQAVLFPFVHVVFVCRFAIEFSIDARIRCDSANDWNTKNVGIG